MAGFEVGVAWSNKALEPTLALAIQPMQFSIVESDPQSADALSLLREAAIETRNLYPELQDPMAPWPTNLPNPPRGVYFIACVGERAVGMGAHRPLDEDATEVCRLYVLPDARSGGVARAILRCIEDHAGASGFRRLLLETGYRQLAAMRLYECNGFKRIASLGSYKDDPTSVCYEKSIRLPPTK